MSIYENDVEYARPIAPSEKETTGRGEVTSFDAQLGYGFIQPAEGGPDVFLHVSGLVHGLTRKTVQVGMQVVFRVVPDTNGGKRLRAVDVKKA